MTRAARLVPVAPGAATLHADIDPGAVGPDAWRLEVRLVDGGPCVPLGVALERHRGRPPVLAPAAEPVERTPSAAARLVPVAVRAGREPATRCGPGPAAGVRRLPRRASACARPGPSRHRRGPAALA